MHALRTIYRAYGIKPELENIRKRLGTDYYAVVWLRDSTGTFQPDLEMVLEQDFFKVEYGATPEALENHALSGHLAALLVKRAETGGLHWIVAGPSKSGATGRILLIDSLKPEPEDVSAKQFFSSSIISAVMVKPTSSRKPSLSSIESLLSGAIELVRSISKM